MKKYNLNKSTVASILLLIHVEMSCSSQYNPEVDKNRLGDQTNVRLLKSDPNSFNSNEQIETLALFAEEEEACQVFSQGVNYKKPDKQESGPVHANLTLDRENFSRIEKLDVATVSLPSNMNDNSEQLINQELVSSFSTYLNHEMKDVNNFTQSRNQVIISEKQVDLQEEVNQEGAIDTQLVEAIQIDPIAVQQAPNQTLIVKPSHTLTDSEEEVNEETATDAGEYERRQQANRNIMLALQGRVNSHVRFATILGVLGVVLLMTGGGIWSLILKQGLYNIIWELLIISAGLFCVISSIILFKRFYM